MEENRNFTTVESLNNRVEEKYLDLVNNGEIKTILKTMGRFIKETVENDILICDQMPNATYLCTKAEWEKIKQRELIESPKYVQLVGVTLYKNEQGHIDDKGSLHVIGTNKLHPYIRTVYDVSQTTGKEMPAEIDKEYLAKYFEAVKGTLEHISKGYTVKYEDNLQEKSFVNNETKEIVVRNGMAIIDVIGELVDKTSGLLLDSRRQEGLTKDDLKSIAEIENKAAIYAIRSRYGLDTPDFDFREIERLSDEDKMKFIQNLTKVRSVVYQLGHNIENSIDFTIRGLNKEKSNTYQNTNTTDRNYQNSSQRQNDGEEL